MAAGAAESISTVFGASTLSAAIMDNAAVKTRDPFVDVPVLVLAARPALSAAALQRALHPHLLTPRSVWRWPLPASPTAALPTSTSTVPEAHHWLSRSRSGAALSDPVCFAFVARGGAAALARPSAGVRLLTVPTIHAPLARRAVSVALFTLLPEPSVVDGTLDRAVSIAAVGYASGAAALFDVRTAAFRAVSRPVVAELRRMRFHTTLHWGDSKIPSAGGLFAVAGSGELCLLPTAQIRALLRAGRSADPTARGWTLWSVPSRGHVNDAAPLGAAAASICEVDPQGPGAPLRIVAAGADPALVAYECSRDPVFSARAAARKAASSVYSFAWGLFSSPPSQTGLLPSPVLDIDDAPRVIAAATPGPAWTDHSPDENSFYLPNVKVVGQTARNSVTAVLTAPARVFRISSDEGRKTVEAANGSPVLRDVGRQDSLGDADPSHGSLDAASLRALLAERGEPIEQRPPMNARIGERIAAAPLGCGLFAAVDNLGRVLVQDARDMVTLRVLKGYRDAQVAWLAPENAKCAPLLAVLAPRINVLELHTAASGKRVAAFRIPRGACLLQTPDFHVFCITPSGAVFELAVADPVVAESGNEICANGGSGMKPLCVQNGAVQSPPSPAPPDVPQPPDEETVAAFLEAARSQNIVRSTDILQTFAGDPAKVAYLMARLLDGGDAQGRVTPDVHVALAARAANLASAERSLDLEMRYFSHGRLAESYGLLTFDERATGGTGERRSRRLLRDDALGAGLADSAAVERATVATRPEMKRLSVEEFILAHSIAPSSDVESRNSVTLLPRLDLTKSEKEDVAHTYFSGLLDEPADTADVDPGEEAVGSQNVFLALRDLHALPVAEIASIFVTFFLTAPIDALLSTPVALHASALRCVLARLRSSGNRKLVDEVILSACKTTTRYAVNAVLLARLCAVGEDDSPGGSGDVKRDAGTSLGRFLHVLALLDEVLLLRRLVAGTSLAREVVLNTAAQHCAGARGTAERRAVAMLLGKAEYAPAANLLDALLEFRRPQLEWYESSVVSEEAIQICRRRTAALLDGDLYAVMLPAVADWIRAAGPEQDFALRGDATRHFLGIRTVMLAAHAHVPDASVDAVRCLQLAEAMTAVMMASGSGIVSGTENDTKVFAGVVEAKVESVVPMEVREASAVVESEESKDMNVCFQENGNTCKK